jgi:hypothetical protein
MSRDAANNEPTGPVATITRRAADRLRAGHLWVYRSDIERLSANLEDTAEATAHSSPSSTPAASPLAPRSIAAPPRSPCASSRASPASPARNTSPYSRDRAIRSALNLRETLVPEASHPPNHRATNACRLFFSEADDLPGIVADRYNGIVVLQLLTQGTAQDDVRRVLVDLLSEQPLARDPRRTSPTPASASWNSSRQRPKPPSSSAKAKTPPSRPSSPSMACAFTSMPPPARRPAPSSISA